VVTKSEVGLDATRKSRKVLRLETNSCTIGEGQPSELLERLPAPEAQCVLQQIGRLMERAALERCVALPCETFEFVHVHGPLGHVQHVSTVLRRQDRRVPRARSGRGAERSAQSRDLDLQVVHRSVRSVLPPDLLD
jgi:hypothetical protein